MENLSTRWRAPPRSRNIGQRSRRRTCRTESGRFSCCRRQSSKLALGCNPGAQVPVYLSLVSAALCQ